MNPAKQKRLRLGIGLVGGGLLVQLGTGLLWSPGSFILSAALGLPLVLLGAFFAWRALPSQDDPR